MLLSQGDVVFVSFDPSQGREPAKRRPAVVVSSTSFNASSSMAICAPVTSTNNGYPLHVEINAGESIHGWVCLEQMRALDLDARHAEAVGEIDSAEMGRIKNLTGSIFGL